MKISLLSTDVLFASEINQIRVRETSSISTDFLLNFRTLSDLKLWFTLYSILSWSVEIDYFVGKSVAIQSCESRTIKIKLTFHNGAIF